MTQTCHCGQCGPSTTPLSIANRPGLAQLRYRIGTHRSFFTSMIAEINRSCGGDPGTCDPITGSYPLRDRLKTRKVSDPSIAMIDAWVGGRRRPDFLSGAHRQRGFPRHSRPAAFGPGVIRAGGLPSAARTFFRRNTLIRSERARNWVEPRTTGSIAARGGPDPAADRG